MPVVLVTGASGFVGGALCRALQRSGNSVVAVSRQLPNLGNSVKNGGSIDLNWKAVGPINGDTSWRMILHGVNTVIHCAARAHVKRGIVKDSINEYRQANVDGTLKLGLEAAAAGVRRFVFLSSIGVNGNESIVPFTEVDRPNPQDAYSVSKLEAEQALLAVAYNTGMEVVIIRPPMLYGPNAPGNFGRLVQLIDLGVPLPLGAVRNKRSLLAIDNLVSLVLLCSDPVRSPSATNEVFVVSDGEDISTTILLQKVAQAGGRPIRLLPIPTRILGVAASLFGMQAMGKRVLGNLQINASKVRVRLGWKPVVSLDEQLAGMFK